MTSPELTVEERGKRLFEAMPDDIRRQLLGDADLISRELETREKAYPSKDFVPNVGQERALLPLRRVHETYGDFPQGVPVTGGNGSGKTGLLAIVLAGVAQGPEFLHPRWFGQHEYFRHMRDARKDRTVYIRIVCDGADVTEAGSVYQQIKKWIPSAQFTDKQGPYYTRIRIPSPDPEIFKPVSVDIKTHKQDLIAHAGPDYDLILFNEPCPKDIWNENMGRLRMGGRWMAFLTPLHMASYLFDVINGDAPDGEIAHTTISIWENCADIPGNRGVLEKATIEKLIRRWREVNPLEVVAREEGKFMFLAGSVFSIYTERVHQIDPVPIEKNWQIFQCIDPHPVKPHVSIWAARDAMQYVRVIAEYPSTPWEHISTTPLTLRHHGDEFRRIESGRHPKFQFVDPMKVTDRLGDPNALKATNPNTARTLQTEYEDVCDLSFRADIDNSDVMLRHNLIRQFLFYNPQQPVDSVNCPRLYVSSACRNMNAALALFRYRQVNKQGEGMGYSDKVEETWKCWIDALGYLLLILSEEAYTAPGRDPYGDDEDLNDIVDSYGDVVFTSRFEGSRL